MGWGVRLPEPSVCRKCALAGGLRWPPGEDGTWQLARDLAIDAASNY